MIFVFLQMGCWPSVRSRWVDIGQVIFCVCFNIHRDGVWRYMYIYELTYSQTAPYSNLHNTDISMCAYTVYHGQFSWFRKNKIHTISTSTVLVFLLTKCKQHNILSKNDYLKLHCIILHTVTIYLKSLFYFVITVDR